MSGHTPGPWHVIPGYSSAPAGVQNSGGEIIADVFCPKGFNPLVVMVEIEANARLIAAAPKMLDALKAVEARHVAICKEFDLVESHNLTLNLVRPAIDEAESRQ